MLGNPTGCSCICNVLFSVAVLLGLAPGCFVLMASFCFLTWLSLSLVPANLPYHARLAFIVQGPLSESQGVFQDGPV